MPAPSAPPGRFFPIALLSLALTAAAPGAYAAWAPNGIPICVETQGQYPPSITFDGAYGAIVAWPDFRFGNADIFAQRVDSSGVVQWTANGVPVCSATGSQFGPVVVPDGGGGAVVFWYDHRGATDDIYAQRVDGQGAARWPLHGIPLATDPNYDERFPSAISDGSFGIAGQQGFIVLWKRTEPGNDILRMQHVDLAGGNLWTTPGFGGVPLTSGGVPIGGYDMVTDGTGTPAGAKGAFVTWAEDRAAFAGFEIRARRINASGVPQWATDGVSICALGGDQTDPDIEFVGAGRAIIAWVDGRSLEPDVYAQMLDISGNVLWQANGVPVCRVSGHQERVQIASDGAGGIIAVWQDTRYGSSGIHAQRVDANGQRLWNLEGIRVCSSSSIQHSPAIVGDGAGGAIVAWQDSRHPGTTSLLDIEYDVYAQRVDASGNLLWPADGVPIGSALGTQISVLLTTDVRNGAIAAWYDDRAGNGDIYANRIFSSGGIVDVPAPGAPPSKLRFAFASSNPARGEVRLRLDLPEPAAVTVDVLDALGRRVRSLGADARFEAGTHVIRWDRTDESGAPAAAGVYFVRARAGNTTLVTRVVALR